MSTPSSAKSATTPAKSRAAQVTDTAVQDEAAQKRLARQRSPAAVRRVSAKAAVLVVVVVVAAVFPMMATGAQVFLWETILVQAVFALSVNLLVGHAGIPTFGQAAFYGTGAYAVAALSSHGLPVVVCLVLAMLITGFWALLVGLVASRAAGLGMLMLTLAVAQGMFAVLDRSSLFGGTNGKLVSLVDWPGVSTHAYWYALFIVCAIAAALMWLIVHSPFGLTMHATRDDPLRTLHLGIPVRKYRLIMFTFAGAFGGLAGALFAFTTEAVDPSAFDWTISGNALLMCLLGGLYSFWGPAVGAVIYELLNYQLAQVLPKSWMLFLGIAVMLVVLGVPHGAVSAPERIGSLMRFVRGRTRSYQSSETQVGPS
jgi:branched-chain amino acid transport system permease protein